MKKGDIVILFDWSHNLNASKYDNSCNNMEEWRTYEDKNIWKIIEFGTFPAQLSLTRTLPHNDNHYNYNNVMIENIVTKTRVFTKTNFIRIPVLFRKFECGYQNFDYTYSY